MSELVEYRQDRAPDYQYHELLQRLHETGHAAVSGMDEGSRELLGHMMRFDLRNGFPLITERDLTRGTTPEIIANYESNPGRRPVAGAVKQGLAEIIGFINGARTQEELESYGCKFWRPWTTDEAKAKKRGLELGDLGPGSYGAAFHDFPDGDTTFDQYAAMIEQIKARPELRTHIISPFIPPYISRAPGRTQKVLVVPCHGLQHYNIDTVNKEISLVHWQRSADVPIGLPFNMVHYGALLMMVGQVTGYTPKELVFQISNAHIYDQHDEHVEELLAREPMAFPRLTIDPSVKRLEDFRVEHFWIEDYNAHPPMNMGGTAV
ncbi:thymidylate synthase [Candidatus Saccharibacteria bacterium 32-50-13]|nr:MAG: thymidylate synthase [Candidatus Saccharibacteria bacterium 32-50-13]